MVRARPDIVRHRSATASWDMARARPHPAIAAHVRGYTGWDEHTAAPMRRRELPSGDIPLVLNLGAPFTVRPADAPAAAAVRVGSFVAGLHDRAVVTEHPGASCGVQVDLTPIGARMLLGHPMHELARRVVDLDDVVGPGAPRLLERLAAAGDWGARFDLLDAALAARLGRARPPAPDAVWAWRRLDASAGRVGVAELATEIGCSRRHLAARFRDEIGLAPKLAARVLRFEAAVGALRAADPPPLGVVALRCGYYDQAHLNRDVREFAGLAPRALMAGRLPADGGLAAA